MATGLKSSPENKSPRGVKSIFARLLIYYLTLALVLSVVLTFSARWLLNRQFLLSAENELRERGTFVAELLHSPELLAEMLDYNHFQQMEKLTDATMIYFTTDMVGHRMPQREIGRQDSKRLQYCTAEGTCDEEMLRSVLMGNTVSGTKNLGLTESKSVYVGIPIWDDDGNVIGAIVVYRTLTFISSRSSRILLSVLTSLVFASLIALIMAFLFGRSLAKPIVQLNAAAEKMAQGEYGLRVGVQSKDEIGRLSATLNQLSAALQEVIGKLRDEKTKLEMILSSIGEGIVAVDTQGEIVRVNGAALSILEIDTADSLPQSDAREDIRRLYDALGNAAALRAKRRLSWTTPTNRLIEAVLSPVTDPETDAPLGVVALIRDVSEEQRLEQLRREYIGNISHELRTPLVGIRGMTEPLLDGVLETEEEKQDCYRVIYRETLRLEKLITEMLELSRLQSGKTQIETENLPPVPILESALRRIEARSEENGICIQRDFCREDALVRGNEDRILQIVTILLDNAMDFTPNGGSVTVFCREEGTVLRMGVTDTGSGIDPVDLPYIWERFYKADRSRLRTKGTGLGLPIAKLLVELMGGEIAVQTEKGKGTTFAFTLTKAIEGNE